MHLCYCDVAAVMVILLCLLISVSHQACASAVVA